MPFILCEDRQLLQGKVNNHKEREMGQESTALRSEVSEEGRSPLRPCKKKTKQTELSRYQEGSRLTGACGREGGVCGLCERSGVSRKISWKFSFRQHVKLWAAELGI